MGSLVHLGHLHVYKQLLMTVNRGGGQHTGADLDVGPGEGWQQAVHRHSIAGLDAGDIMAGTHPRSLHVNRCSFVKGSVVATAGKDIWCEKPMTRTFGEGVKVVDPGRNSPLSLSERRE
jgi:hypothetical protein